MGTRWQSKMLGLLIGWSAFSCSLVFEGDEQEEGEQNQSGGGEDSGSMTTLPGDFSYKVSNFDALTEVSFLFDLTIRQGEKWTFDTSEGRLQAEKDGSQIAMADLPALDFKDFPSKISVFQNSVLAVKSLSIEEGGEMRVVGNKPLIVLSKGDVHIGPMARIDLNSYVNASSGTNINLGAGGFLGGTENSINGKSCVVDGCGCEEPKVAELDLGDSEFAHYQLMKGCREARALTAHNAVAAGGSYGGTGGLSRDTDPDATRFGNDKLIPLLGGGGGAAGGGANPGGAGGGAIQISSATKITIENTGEISAGGGPGLSTRVSEDRGYSGGGGGAGGAILLEAPDVNLLGALLYVNGGSGASSSCVVENSIGDIMFVPGVKGNFGKATSGGATVAGFPVGDNRSLGGAGSSVDNIDGGKTLRSSECNATGGGGGGGGRIRINSEERLPSTQKPVHGPAGSLTTGEIELIE